MGFPIMDIVCIEASREQREKYRVLEQAAVGWGIERLWFASSGQLGIIRTIRFGRVNVLVVVGNFISFEWGFHNQDAETKRNALLEALKKLGLTDDQIVVLGGTETPEQIESLVREKAAARLGATQ